MKGRTPSTVKTATLADRPQEWANLGYWLPFDPAVGIGREKTLPLDLPLNLENKSPHWPSKTYEDACSDLAALHAACGRFEPHHRLLEIACGRGASVKLWTNHFHMNQIDLMEPCGSSYEHLKKKWSPVGSPSCPVKAIFNCRLEEAIQDLIPPSPQLHGFLRPQNATYDRIVCIDSAYHFSSTEDFLALARKCLKPGGMLVWTNFTFSNPSGIHDPSRVLPPWLKWLGISPKSLIDLNRVDKMANDGGFYWHPPWSLDGGVMAGFARFVALRRRRLMLVQRLSYEWLKIEATALALNQLNLGAKGAKERSLLPGNLGSVGYAVLSATLR